MDKLNKIEKFYVMKSINEHLQRCVIETGDFKIGNYCAFGSEHNEIRLTLHIRLQEIDNDNKKAIWLSRKIDEDKTFIVNAVKCAAREELLKKFKEMERDLKTQIVKDLQIQDFVGGKE